MEIVTAFHLFLSRQIRELVQSHVWNCERNEFVVAWKRVDMEPENIRSWIHYIAIYDEAAEEAESKKERVGSR